MHPTLSVIVPEYKGAGMVSELVRRLKEALSGISEYYEIILVNDCSPDNTWEQISLACKNDLRIKGLSLSRNFGQHYAITAGLSVAKGDWVIVMDCDLQDRPEEIPRLYAKALEGWDIVYARRVHKQFGILKKLSSSIFHFVLNWLSGANTDQAIGNFGIYHHKVIAEYNKMGEISRAFGSLINYLGFRSTAVDVEHSTRAEGKSSYNLSKLLHLATDVILSNSNKPLKMASWLGFSMSALAFLLAAYNVIAKIAGFITISGYTSTIFSIWFVGGLLLLVLGIIGLYIGRIFNQVKGRQLFIISDKINFND